MRWTQSEVGGLDTSTFVEPQLITYSTFDNRNIPAFVYTKPSRSRNRSSFISMVVLRGNRVQVLAVHFNYGLISFQGATVITPNVRGSEGYGKTYLGLDNGFQREDSVKDIGALLDWIAQQPDLDVSVASMEVLTADIWSCTSAVHYSERLSAAIDIVGISNFVTFLKNTKDYRRDLRRVE